MRVSPELKFEIEKYAAKENRTINSFLINAIKQYIENRNAKKIGSTDCFGTP